ncbi:MAG: indolepyruvate oxidoreductase subunit beta family protein [Pseudomonadota bacterium]
MNVVPRNIHDQSAGIIKLAILAVGGQGGGVLMNWIVSLAEANGFHAQATSVPGVAQRTGATIYYVEMLPAREAEPILSLMPAAGDVDIVLASELMEAGRAIQRGFVTSRTTLIASTHRALAVSEKIVPGDGVFDKTPVLAAAEASAARFLAADLEALAAQNGSVISASLFGALAGANVLPFPRAAFEATIERSGKGVAASLKAFGAGFEAVRGTAASGSEALPVPVAGQSADGAKVSALKGAPRLREAFDRLAASFAGWPDPARAMAHRGLQKVVDFQNLAYGRAYVARLIDLEALSHDAAFLEAAAKHLANAMAYDDVIRVADRKVRAARTARVRAEVGATEAHTLAVTEYFHPRAQEVCGLFPAPLGAFVEARPRLLRALDRVVNRGRRIRTDRLRGFLPLYAVASLRPLRRTMLRHRHETAHITAWLGTVARLAPVDIALATEVLRCRRLIKGYSDTHVRGLSKFDKVLGALPLLEGRADGADWLRRLKEAALLDEPGTALDGALKTVASLDAPAARAA